MTNFYELDAQVKGQSSLEGSLVMPTNICSVIQQGPFQYVGRHSGQVMNLVCSLCQASLLGEECLEDDNQYFCNFCQSKVNARRQMKLESLPPYLCISLQRFIFDMKVQARHRDMRVMIPLAWRAK